MKTQDYDALLITAGAGMGVDSGLPDFRGTEGFWKAYPIIKELGYKFEEMATPSWFHEKPELAWAFYGHRLNLYREIIPHEGFQLLKEFGEKLKYGYGVFTSNVDGQFQKAGFKEECIYEIHGSIHHFQCSNNCSRNIWEAPIAKIKIDEARFEAQSIPTCPSCGKVARPNILMFSDGGWIHDRQYKQETYLNKWLDNLLEQKARLLIIEIGAGKAIPSIRHLSEHIKKKHQARFYRINPRESENKFGESIPLGGLEGIREVIGMNT